MIDFTVVKKSRKSRARLGLLQTPHGVVATPALVPVATQAVVKTLTSEEVTATKTQALISNTFHLHRRPGERVVQRAGGLHRFMRWPKPLMTDSAGFQVFSLGFGHDLGLGKIIRWNAGRTVRPGHQPQHLTITERGVRFRSPEDGTTMFIGPRESIRVQEALGADIILAFDECPPPVASKAYVRQSLDRTHRWADACLRLHRTRQALFGVVQGGKYKDLRQQSATFLGGRPFSGYAVGGEFGSDKTTMAKMIGWVTDALPDDKPRHLLGIGHPDDIPRLIKAGIDTFDCIVPTHYARHGTAFTSSGRLDMTKRVWLTDRRPLGPRCACTVCATYSRSYVTHLLRSREITALRLLTFHNLWYFNTLVEQYRAMIARGKL